MVVVIKKMMIIMIATTMLVVVRHFCKAEFIAIWVEMIFL